MARRPARNATVATLTHERFASSDPTRHEVSLARMPRYAAPGIPQHVTQRGTNRSAIFVADADYRFFHECLRAACEKHGCHVHAYVLMSNHVHLLLTPATGSAIGRVMQTVCRRYVQRFNDTHERTGTLCQGRYKATVVDTEQYLFACHRYIELNPVRAGLARNARDYTWSSHRGNAFGVTDHLVSRTSDISHSVSTGAHANRLTARCSVTF